MFSAYSTFLPLNFSHSQYITRVNLTFDITINMSVDYKNLIMHER